MTKLAEERETQRILKKYKEDTKNAFVNMTKEFEQNKKSYEFVLKHNAKALAMAIKGIKPD